MMALLIILIPILIFALLIFTVVKRGLELSLLCKDGEPIIGTVISKSKRARNKGSTTRYYITYKYLGWNGGEQKHRSLVSYETYSQFNENSPIDLVVSKSKPSVSAPAYLVEEAKKAFRK